MTDKEIIYYAKWRLKSIFKHIKRKEKIKKLFKLNDDKEVQK